MTSPTIWFLLLLLACLPSPALAKDQEKDLTNAARKIDRAASTPAGAEKVSAKLAEEFNVSPSVIKDLRAQKLGYGEIGILLAMSRATNQPVPRLLQRFRSGEGWGKMANRERVKLGPIIRAVEKANPTPPAVQSKSRGVAPGDGQKGRGPAGKDGPGGFSGVGLPGQSPGQGKGGGPGEGRGGGMGPGGRK